MSDLAQMKPFQVLPATLPQIGCLTNLSTSGADNNLALQLLLERIEASGLKPRGKDPRWRPAKRLWSLGIPQVARGLTSFDDFLGDVPDVSGPRESILGSILVEPRASLVHLCGLLSVKCELAPVSEFTLRYSRRVLGRREGGHEPYWARGTLTSAVRTTLGSLCAGDRWEEVSLTIEEGLHALALGLLPRQESPVLFFASMLVLNGYDYYPSLRFASNQWTLQAHPFSESTVEKYFMRMM